MATGLNTGMSSSSQHEMQTGQKNGHLCPFHELRARAEFSRIPTESELSGHLPPTVFPRLPRATACGSHSQTPEASPPRVQCSCVMGIEAPATRK